MNKYLLGKKLGMSQMFDTTGKRVPVTLVTAGPCEVTQEKTKEKDGYASFQLGFDKIEKASKITKSMNKKPFRFLKEFKGGEHKVGDSIDVSVFVEGESVRVSATSKGKGFQGAVKRWGFHGRRATHGVKHEHRTLGSVGATFPQRVIKGKKMAGRMGSDRTTVKNLKVMKVDKDNNLLVLKGAVPGRTGILVEITA
jgi:large subunit ribosomal protein L3